MGPINSKTYKHEDSPNRITGKRLPDRFPVIELKEGERLLYDIESGYPYKVTEEYYQSYMKIWKSVVPELKENDRILGTVFVSGTGGDSSTRDGEELKKLFYDPKDYNFKEYGKEEDNSI